MEHASGKVLNLVAVENPATERENYRRKRGELTSDYPITRPPPPLPRVSGALMTNYNYCTPVRDISRPAGAIDWEDSLALTVRTAIAIRLKELDLSENASTTLRLMPPVN